jgi:gas vesicle protein
MSEEKNSNAKFFIGVVLGGIIGAIILFLMGTKDGKKTRKELEHKGRELLDDLHEKLDEIEEQGRELAEKGEKLKKHLEEEIEDKKEYLTDEATERVDQVLAKVEAIQEKGLVGTTNLRKKLFKNLPKKK